ncbi:hypothetical protein TNCV_736021 [Trichonephila clavipes]|uniref:Uncharacterized protein n=1 Tax=Trichonephila clavipes TaxID=2585209 RepID=A0A8X6SSF0_TRICX|nr:hypothetical protein TNCV_736021 [Trichonephila clavipes]
MRTIEDTRHNILGTPPIKTVVKITTRSSRVDLTAALYGIHYVQKIPVVSRILREATEIRAMRSSTEGEPASHTPKEPLNSFNGQTATAGSDVVKSGRPIFDEFFQHLWPYIGNNTPNVIFQMVKRLWLIRIDQ